MALVFVVATAGCTSGSDSESKPAEKDVVQTIDPAKAVTLELGNTLEVVAELPQRFEGDPVQFSAFTADGKLVGAVSPELADPAEANITWQSRPVMYDVATKTFTLLDDSERRRPTWISQVRGNENAVVWVEGFGTQIGTSEFAFYAYDRLTRKVTTLAEFADPHGKAIYGHDLDIAGETAYFSTPVVPIRTGKDPAIYSVPVDGSKPASVLAEGEGLKIAGDTLSYVTRTPRADLARQVSLDLRTGVTTPAPVNQHAEEPGFCGSEITEAYETSCLGRKDADGHVQDAVLTIKEASGRKTVFKPFPTESLNGPVPHDIIPLGRWTGITLTGDGGELRKFLVDLDTREVKVFPENTTFASLSPDRTRVLVSSYADVGPGAQRIVRIPKA